LKEYIDSVAIAGAPNASETAKGLVEEATQAQTNAGTDVGETGARLFVTPSKYLAGLPEAKTLIPQSNADEGAAPSAASVVGTTARVGQVIVPFKIVANKISTTVASVNVAGTIDFTLYSEDGQTQLFSVTSANIAAGGTITISIPSVTIRPGVYYILANANSTANVNFFFYSETNSPFGNAQLTGGIAGEPVTRGTLAITADTPPATITPSSITSAGTNTLCFRLDN
jgi:hypothetical protein